MRGMHVPGSVAAGTLSEVPARHSLQAIRRARVAVGFRVLFIVALLLPLPLIAPCLVLVLGLGI